MTFTRWFHDCTKKNFKRTDIEEANKLGRERRSYLENQESKMRKRLNREYLNERTGGQK